VGKERKGKKGRRWEVDRAFKWWRETLLVRSRERWCCAEVLLPTVMIRAPLASASYHRSEKKRRSIDFLQVTESTELIYNDLIEP
jgi:hypothetical protein